MFSKKAFFLLVVLYRIFLDWIYIYQIFPIFAYERFTYTFSTEAFILSWIFLLFFSLFVSFFLKVKSPVVSYAAVMFFFLRLVPLTSYLSTDSFPASFYLLNFIFWFLFYVLLLNLKRIKVPLHFKSEHAIYWITLLMLLVVVYVSGRYTGFRMNFNLANVYELRMEARNFSMPLWLTYLWPATQNTLPILMVFFMIKKKWGWSILIAFIIFLNFSVNGSKSTLFKMFLCFGLQLLAKPEKMLKYLILGFMALCVFSIIESILLDTSVISSMVIRRMLYVPNLLDYLYFDFIDQNGPVFYNSEEASAIAFDVGNEYFDKSEMRCNNGLFTDAYSNLGWLGIFVYPFVLAMFFKVCESAFKGVNPQIVLFATFLIVTTFGSTTITTSLLTHGLFLLCLVLYCMPSLSNRCSKYTI